MSSQLAGQLTSDGLPLEPVAIIGCRVADKSRVPIAGSSMFQCSRCSEHVMLSPATQRRMRLADVVICLDCAAAIAEQRGQAFIRAADSESQRQERVEHNARQQQRSRTVSKSPAKSATKPSRGQLPLFEPSGNEMSGLAPAARPAARATDPATSHEAAESYRSSGQAESDSAAICEVLSKSSVGLTAGEIAKELGGHWTNVKVSRRTSEMEHANRIRRGEIRVCRAHGTRMVTWIARSDGSDHDGG